MFTGAQVHIHVPESGQGRHQFDAVVRKNTVVTADIAPDAVRSENDHRPMVLIVDDSPMITLRRDL